MSYEPAPPIYMAPQEVAPETFLLRSALPAFGAPMSVYVNSLIIRGEQTVIVDTNMHSNREAWLNDVTSLVDPKDVRWIFISHDDYDHTGNVAEMMDLCPNATYVTCWSMNERMGGHLSVPPSRMRWMDDGDTLDIGDRKLAAIRPPAYDSPTTRGLFDPKTGVYWASDAFATPMPAQPVEHVDDLPPPMWAEGMAMFHHHALCPWLSIVDRKAYAAEVAKLNALDIKVIASAHTPVITGGSVATAMKLMAELPDTVPPPHPDQQVLEAILSGAPA